MGISCCVGHPAYLGIGAKGFALAWDIASVSNLIWSRVRRCVRPQTGGIKLGSSYYPMVDSCQIPNLSFIYEMFLGRTASGTFVEIGAYDGVFVSNSWGLASRGWRGLLIEPQSAFASRCSRNHQQHPAVHVERTAIGRPGLTSIQLTRAGALTTANVELVKEYRATTWAAEHVTASVEVVPCETMDSLIERFSIPPEFEVLIVDVEGGEADVLAGFDVQRWRPLLMIWELADIHPDLSSTAKADAQVLLSIQSTGYQIVYKDHINTVFVRMDVWSAATQS